MASGEPVRVRTPSPLQVCWYGFLTFCHRTYEDVVRNYSFTIAPPAISTALYLLIFGKLIGARVGTIGGLSYAQFIAPGLVLMPAITSAYSQAGFSLVVGKIWRLIDEYLITPQPTWTLVVNHATGGVIRGVMVGLTASVVVLLISHTHVVHVFAALGALVLAALLASLAGFINGIFAKTLDQATWVPTFVLTPLTYLSGVFYSVSNLPPWAQKLSFINPIFYITNLCRYCVFGKSDVSASACVSFIVVASGVLFAIAVVLVKKGVGIRE